LGVQEFVFYILGFGGLGVLVIPKERGFSSSSISEVWVFESFHHWCGVGYFSYFIIDWSFLSNVHFVLLSEGLIQGFVCLFVYLFIFTFSFQFYDVFIRGISQIWLK
jgi:hypothetical protein